MNGSAVRGEPVTMVSDLASWVASRRVKLSIRYLKRTNEFEVTASTLSRVPGARPHTIRTKYRELHMALSITVDTMNDLLAFGSAEHVRRYEP